MGRCVFILDRNLFLEITIYTHFSFSLRLQHKTNTLTLNSTHTHTSLNVFAECYCPLRVKCLFFLLLFQRTSIYHFHYYVPTNSCNRLRSVKNIFFTLIKLTRNFFFFSFSTEHFIPLRQGHVKSKEQLLGAGRGAQIDKNFLNNLNIGSITYFKANHF